MNHISDEFFCEEKRDGFLVTEAMKRYWAASLKTVQIFSKFCISQHLKWWADWGTLLGARRHKGFIPWDDDIDLGMMRDDYDRFLGLAQEELQNRLVVDVYDNRWHRYSGFAVVNNHRATLFSEDVLGEYYTCPFPAGFDLFVYDNCPEDEEEKNKWRLDGLRIYLAMQVVREKGIVHPETRDALHQIGIEKEWKDDAASLLAELGKRFDQVATRYNDRTTSKVISFGLFIDDAKIGTPHRAWFDKLREVPFEYSEILVPEDMDAVLNVLFGEDYMTPIRGEKMAHNYPLYQRDIKETIRFLEGGGMYLDDLPPFLSYIKREAQYLGVPFQNKAKGDAI